MSDLPPERREELRRLLDAATPGPWEVSRHASPSWVWGADGTPVGDEDAEFVVAAVNALPSLLDALNARDAALTEAVTWMRDIARELNYEATGSAARRPNHVAKLIRLLELLTERADLLAGSVVREVQPDADDIEGSTDALLEQIRTSVHAWACGAARPEEVLNDIDRMLNA